MDLTSGDLLSPPYEERHLSFDRRRGASVWPEGARLAVYIYIAPEEWLWDRKEHHFPRGTRQVAGEPVPSLSTRSAVKYGYQVGLPRLSEILLERGIRVTLWVGGAAAEQHPEIIRQLADQGHEVSGHSYSQGEPLSLLSREEQRTIIKQSVDAITRVAGRRPLGWIGPGAVCTVDTIELLAEEGFLYHADLQDDELPYFIDIGGRTIVEVPYRMVGNINDFQVVEGHSTEAAFAYLKGAFDAYYNESSIRPLQFNFGTHPFISGRPDSAAVFARFLDYVGGHKGVWVATYQEIAEWWLKRFGRGYEAIAEVSV